MDEIEIVATIKFDEGLKKVYDYLYYSWSKKIADEFVVKLKNKVAYIKYSPFSGTPYKKHKDVFRILVTKHNALFYKVYDSRIELLNIFDTRQNPSKSPL